MIFHYRRDKERIIGRQKGEKEDLRKKKEIRQGVIGFLSEKEDLRRERKENE